MIRNRNPNRELDRDPYRSFDETALLAVLSASNNLHVRNYQQQRVAASQLRKILCAWRASFLGKGRAPARKIG
jgi:hypothetical protein